MSASIVNSNNTTANVTNPIIAEIYHFLYFSVSSFNFLEYEMSVSVASLISFCDLTLNSLVSLTTSSVAFSKLFVKPFLTAPVMSYKSLDCNDTLMSRSCFAYLSSFCTKVLISSCVLLSKFKS